MSASLVGSEMCIRDSSNLQAPTTHDIDLGVASQAEGSWFLCKGDVREAVSYTHLTLPTICSV
eukprot:11264314-Alexandrium_andersonii.AAC.1